MTQSITRRRYGEWVPRAASTAPAPRRLVRRGERRAALVEVAIELFRSEGPDLTMADIAAAAGVSEATVFYVFEDRAALLRACIEHLVDADALRRAAELDTSHTVEQRITAVTAAVRQNMVEVVPLMLAAMRSPSRSGGPPAMSAFAPIEALVIDAFGGSSLDRPAPWSEPVDVLAADLLGRLFGQVFRSVVGDAPLPPIERTVTTFLYGALSNGALQPGAPARVSPRGLRTRAPTA
jgi:AcrR family transcriptional regulator